MLPVMRSNLLSYLLVSMTFTLASACSGDDGSTGGSTGGDTGTTSTGSSTSSTGSSTSTSTSGPTTATDTDTGPATDTGTGDTGTGDTGAGDTGTAGSGTAGSDTGTGGSVTICGTFCADYFATCGNTDYNDYGTEADCVTTCEGWTPDQLACRQMHLGLVQDPANDEHCGHASADGANVCP